MQIDNQPLQVNARGDVSLKGPFGMQIDSDSTNRYKLTLDVPRVLYGDGGTAVSFPLFDLYI
jgi:hypothetical protein